MRKLKGSDIFKMSKIIKKINIDFNNLNKDGDTTQVGLQAIKMIIENLWQAEDEVNEFIGNLIGCTGQEFADKDLSEIIEIFKEFKDIPEVESFLSLVGQ